MKKLIPFILFLVLCLSPPVLADGWFFSGGTAAPSYLFSESFDGSTACGDGSHSNCDNTYTITGTSIDFNYTTAPAPLVGTYSCFMDSDGGYDRIKGTFTDDSPVYLYFIIDFETLTLTTEKPWLFLKDSGDNTTYAELKFTTSETIKILHGTASDTGSTVIGTANTYHIWVEYTKDSGPDDGVMKLYLNTSDTKPGAVEAEISAGTSESDVGLVDFIAYEAEFEYILDKVRVDDVTIGSSPS